MEIRFFCLKRLYSPVGEIKVGIKEAAPERQGAGTGLVCGLIG
ncbi:MAG: hypothetical protein WAO19_12455 [Candidatus Kryptoniota bacterium]